MRKTDIDHLLEAAVAKALGVSMPRLSRRKTAVRKTASPLRQAA